MGTSMYEILVDMTIHTGVVCEREDNDKQTEETKPGREEPTVSDGNGVFVTS